MSGKLDTPNGLDSIEVKRKQLAEPGIAKCGPKRALDKIDVRTAIPLD